MTKPVVPTKQFAFLEVPITRFAPSPTGKLHLGHIYSALFAQKMGNLQLRIEDIDFTRSKEEYIHAIINDLKLIGINRQPAWRQSQRLDKYHAALQQLISNNLVYPCFCTRKEIQQAQNPLEAPHNASTKYAGTCKKLSERQKQQKLDSGIAYSYRIDTDKCREAVGESGFYDLLRGQQTVDYSQIGDCVIARKDIHTSYHLACVIDDHEQGITLVTRGVDLFDSCHIQRLLQQLLGLTLPKYCHHPLLMDDKNQRLAKRRSSLPFSEIMTNGQFSLEQLGEDFNNWYEGFMQSPVSCRDR